MQFYRTLQLGNPVKVISSDRSLRLVIYRKFILKNKMEHTHTHTHTHAQIYYIT